MRWPPRSRGLAVEPRAIPPLKNGVGHAQAGALPLERKTMTDVKIARPLLSVSPKSGLVELGTARRRELSRQPSLVPLV